MAIYYPLKPISTARHRDDSKCPDAGWKGLSDGQKARLSIMARKAAIKQGVSLKKKHLDEWRHSVAIRACGVRISEATQSHWDDLFSAFLDLGGKPEAAMNAQIRGLDNKRRIAMHKLTKALEANSLHPSYAETICQTQYRIPLADASAKQLWCLFFTVTNRAKAKAKKA